MEHNELKPCPFCGSKDVYIDRNCHDAGMAGKIEMVFVRCGQCGATGAKADDWDDYHKTITQNKTLDDFAAERWNRRANDGT